jgi:hypothetical protein
MLLTYLDVTVPDLESIHDLYSIDHDFATPYMLCTHVKACKIIQMHDGYFFRNYKLCILESSMCLLLLQEL